MTKDESEVMEEVTEEGIEEKRKISDVDRITLELIKTNRKLAICEAEKFHAKSETADLSYKYAVIQLYMKYGLTVNDSIDESTGNILIDARKP